MRHEYKSQPAFPKWQEQLQGCAGSFHKLQHDGLAVLAALGQLALRQPLPGKRNDGVPCCEVFSWIHGQVVLLQPQSGSGLKQTSLKAI